MVCSSRIGCGGNWLKNLPSFKKSKGCGSRWTKWSSKKAKSNSIVCESNSKKYSTLFADATCDSNGNRWILGRRIEEVAATEIQASFRAYLARKSLRQLKGSARLKKLLAQPDFRKIQVISALNHFHKYCKTQDQIKALRICMVVESRLQQKNLENQLKVDAKIKEVEKEWSCSSKSKDVREEAAMRRERALSYAFNHQWRANASHKHQKSNSELGKAEWSWSWIAARPWDSPLLTTLQTEPTSPTFKIEKTKTRSQVASTPSQSSSPKPTRLSGGKGSTPRRTFSSGKRVVKPLRRLHSPPSNIKSAAKKDIKVQTTQSLKDQEPVTVTSN